MVGLLGFLGHARPRLRTAYEEDLQRRKGRPPASPPISDADLARLPAPVQRYLRRVGVVGHPRVSNFHVRMHGRFRSGPRGRWMPFTAEQHNFIDEPARLFYMRVTMFGVPVHGYHRYVGSAATMDIRIGGLIPVVHAAGDEMNRSETVTFFNDMCVMAPATLLEPSVTWEPVDDRIARATFSNAGHVIHAELTFNEAGELTDFSSADRFQLSADGKSARKVRWSTPVAGYRTYGPFCLTSGGEARWHDREGDWAYIELTLDDVRYNVASR
jgi:uncharacterized protein DUF6544